MGTWEVVGGCTQAPAAGFECEDALSSATGTVTGTFTFESGSYDQSTDAELRQCGWIDGSGRGAGGSLVIEGNTMDLGGTRTLTFCVQGDTLWLHEEGLEYPELTVVELVRSAGDGGAL
jgi:hypothetical protein